MRKNLKYILILPSLALCVRYFPQISNDSCSQWMAVGPDCLEGCGAGHGKGFLACLEHSLL